MRDSCTDDAKGDKDDDNNSNSIVGTIAEIQLKAARRTRMKVV